MSARLSHRLLAAYLHAAVFLSAYVVLKEFIYWTPLLDSLVSVVGAASIVAASLIVPRFVRHPAIIALNGVLAGGATGIVTLAIWSLVWSYWASDKPVAYPPVAIIVGLANFVAAILWVFSMGFAVAAIAAGGGLAAVAAAAMRRFGGSGIALVLIACLAASVVPASAVFARLGAGMGVIDLATRYGTLRPFPAKVVVDLTVRGERVVLERVVTCQRPRSTREEADAAQADPRLAKPYWFPTLKSFGQVFADGSGVFVLTPNVCTAMAKARGDDGRFATSANVLPADYLPLVGWTPAASSLDTFEVYVDHTAYERPNASVVVNRISMAPLPYGTTESPPDRFAVVGWMRFYTYNPDYGGYYAVAVPRAAWEALPLARLQLTGLRELAFVFGSNPVRPQAQGADGFEDLDVGTQYPEFGRNGIGIPPRVPGSFTPLPGPVVPLRRDGDGWRLFPDESGVISFERGLQMQVYHPHMPEVIALASARADRRRGPHDGAFLFDPETQTLYRIMPTSFHFAEPDTVYSSQTCALDCSDWVALIRKRSRSR